jgi:hypothetical protein
METRVELKNWQRVVIIIMGGFLLGGMWRMRGDAGFGSFWGMLCVSLAYCLFISSVLGYRKKMNYFLFPFLVVSMPLTVNGWGTLNLQPAGILNDPVGGTFFFNPFSGVFIMLCLGFCWIPFFAFLMGRYFSEKQYRGRDFLVVIVAFYAVKYLFLATLAHPLLQLTCGDAYRLFVKGLSDIGVTGSPWKIYLQHFNNIKWAEVITGGRNYFTSINIISSVAGTFAMMGAVLLILKDKLTVKLMLLICSALAVSILAADVFHILGSGGYHLNTFTPPQWLKNNSWGYWEYFTGFFAGLSITAILVLQDKKSGSKGAEISEKLPNLGKNKWVCYIYSLIVLCVGALSAGIVRAIASRLDQHGIFSETGIPMGITIPVLAIPTFIIFAIVLYRNIIKKMLGQPFNADFKTFALTATPIVFSIFTFIDLCVAYTCWDEPSRFGINFLVGLSLVMVIAGYLVLRNALKSSTKA